MKRVLLVNWDGYPNIAHGGVYTWEKALVEQLTDWQFVVYNQLSNSNTNGVFKVPQERHRASPRSPSSGPAGSRSSPTSPSWEGCSAPPRRRSSEYFIPTLPPLRLQDHLGRLPAVRRSRSRSSSCTPSSRSSTTRSASRTRGLGGLPATAAGRPALPGDEPQRGLARLPGAAEDDADPVGGPAQGRPRPLRARLDALLLSRSSPRPSSAAR